MKLEQFSNYLSGEMGCFRKSCGGFVRPFFNFLVSKVNPFWIQLCYFIMISSVGYLALRFSMTKTSSFRPEHFDVFFTSVSALTGASMSTIEMEVFSNLQLIFMTILMFVGGEVFTSILGLYITFKFYPKNNQSIENGIDLNIINPTSSNPAAFVDQIELGLASSSVNKNDKTDASLENNIIKSSKDDNLKYNSLKYLVYVVLSYLLVILIVGSILVSLHVSLVSSARDILKKKGLQIPIFSVFTTVSSFTNCGFIPTNENLIVFKKNSTLLLILIPQILLGNTLYPPSLRFVIWVLKKITNRAEFDYILRNFGRKNYRHLLSSIDASLLAATAFGFIFVQLVIFCSLEWNSSEAMGGMNSFQKLVASLFQVINSRHSGESVFDLSIISPAILVLFVVMMYLPPNTSFLPIRNGERDLGSCEVRKNKQNSFVEYLIFSQLSYLVIFIILVCITEREKMKEDPLNFNVLNITIEVISAYGNVGFTTGYSCKRKLNPDGSCKDTWYGFVGRWSNQGKFILILVMFFGRLKKFNMKGGKAWKLS